MNKRGITINRKDMKDMEIEVNGVKYVSREEPKRKPMSKSIATLMIMAQMTNTYGMPELRTPKNTSKPNVNIVEEFKLIQQKKSKLPSNQRNWVVYQFHKLFEKIKE